jgi:hypothetical protein
MKSTEQSTGVGVMFPDDAEEEKAHLRALGRVLEENLS